MAYGTGALVGAGMVGLGTAMAAVGWVLFSDFRGFVTWHARRTQQMFAPARALVSRFSPWRAPDAAQDPNLDFRHRFQMGLVRVIGAAWLFGGVIVFIVGILVLLTVLTPHR